MLSINERISLRQLQALIIISAMGTGVIVLPRRVAEHAGSDGWMIVIGLVILAIIIGALVSTAARLRPGESFIQSTGFYLTRPVAYILGAVLWLKLVLAAGLELRVFMLVVREVLLRHTPLAVTGVVMLGVAGYAAVKGIETRARVAEVLLCLMVLPFIFLVIIALMGMDWSNLQPVFVTPPEDLLMGTLRLGFIFTGLECLFLVSPYIHPKKNMRRAVVSVLGLAGLVIFTITIITMGKFGRGVSDLPWPVLSMMDMLNLPGAFIERQEALMFSFWIITNFAILNGLLFFGGVLFKDFVRGKKEPAPQRPHGPSRRNKLWQMGVLVTALAIFIITCIPWDEAAIYERMDMMYFTLGAFYLVVLPVILILVSKIKKIGRPAALLAIGTIFLISLNACWDRTEIENRAFVVAVGVDKAQDEFAITLSLPAPTDSNDEEDDPPHIKNASAQTITESIKEIDAGTDVPLYFGQTKILVLGEDLLTDQDMMRSTLDMFNRHQEIDRAVHILAAHGTGADILNATPPGDDLPGRYIAAIFRDKRKIGGTSFNMSLDDVVTQMKFSEAVLIPSLAEENGKLVLSGAALVVDYYKVGQLTADDVRGYLWCKDDGGVGAIVTATIEGQPIPYKVETHSANVIFKENGDKLEAHIKVALSGRIEEGSCKNAAVMIAAAVKKEILATGERMQNEFMVDGYRWLETLRKKQYSLYKVYAEDWKKVFVELEIVPYVTVRVKN